MVAEHHLTLEKDGEFLNALLSNDLNSLRLILMNCNQKKKEAYLQGHFIFDDDHVSDTLYGKCRHLKLPLAYAITFGYFELADLLFEEGVDVLQQDCFGNNVIHSLII